MKKRLHIVLGAMLLTANISFAQEVKDQMLADQYYKQGEFEKAEPLYEKLLNKNPSSGIIYQHYIQTLSALKKYEKAVKVIKKQIKQFSDHLPYSVDLGLIYEISGDPSKADQQFKKTIESLPMNEGSVDILSNTFRFAGKYDLAINSYLHGQKILRNNRLFRFELGNLYAIKGDIPLLIDVYLDILTDDPGKLEIILNSFQDHLSKNDGFEFLKQTLYKKVQKQADRIIYYDVLVWTLIQQNDFNTAFIQVKAIDKKTRGGGHGVYEFAKLAQSNGYYDAAIEAFQYVIKYGDPSMIVTSEMSMVHTKKLKITETNDFTKEDLEELKVDYIKLIDRYGQNTITAPMMKELATLEAFYLQNPDAGIKVLNVLIKFPGITRQFKASCKIELGDIYLVKGEVWESMLLYGQVDKAFKDDPIGDLAKYKNATISYYTGDFEWAQTQLDVLKASTSKLIANDALNLSIFITENLGLDSTITPMFNYAQAELLIYQHRFTAAVRKLDSIMFVYPSHPLSDDIYFIKARMFMKQNNFDEVLPLLEKIIQEHAEDINGDNALFMMAEIHHYELNDIAKATKLYEQLILNYPDSTFAVEARKRFRALRGDSFN